VDIDNSDKKILWQLDLNARAPISEIAKKTRLSRNVVSYRIKKMESEGIIKGYFTEINNSALGYEGFRVFFKYSTYNHERTSKFIASVLEDKRVAWCLECKGVWDLDVIYWCRGRFEFYNLISGIKITNSDLLEKTLIATIVDIWHYPKRYLSNQNMRVDHYGLSEGRKTISKSELDVLNSIAFDSRKSVMQISKETGYAINTVIGHLKRLKSEKIILNYRPFVDVEKLGLIYMRVHLSFQDYGKKEHALLIEEVSQDASVVYLDYYIQGYDLEIELHVKSTEEMQEKLDKWLTNHGRMIREYEIIHFSKEYVVRYLPQF
jgi:DNA-binding Lrp family transcriptional regulator